jgi:molecular chaperone DnaK
VEDAIAALREATAGEDVDRIRQLIEPLNQAVLRFGEAPRRTGDGDGQQQARREKPQAEPGAEPGVVDAEFEEVDDERRRRPQ